MSEPEHLIGFVKKGESVAKVIYPATREDVVVGIGGELRATDHDGEVHIFAAGEWTGVNIRES